jgi:hypothetical protein
VVRAPRRESERAEARAGVRSGDRDDRLALEAKPSAEERHLECGCALDVPDETVPDAQRERIGRDAGVRITVKWDRIHTKCTRGYTRCHGARFIMQISGNGQVAPILSRLTRAGFLASILE